MDAILSDRPGSACTHLLLAASSRKRALKCTFLPGPHHRIQRGDKVFGTVGRPYGRRMAETAALLSDEVFPDVPLRQWVISFPFPLRYLFAAHPHAMGKVLGIVYRAISTHLIHKAGYRIKDGTTGAVTLIQRFGSALNLNIHFHILFLDGVYAYHDNGQPRFQRVRAPDKSELVDLVQSISQRVGRCLERLGLLEQDTQNAWLELDPADDADAMPHLLGSSVSYRIAVGPQQGRKAFMIRTIRPEYRQH